LVSRVRWQKARWRRRAACRAGRGGPGRARAEIGRGPDEAGGRARARAAPSPSCDGFATHLGVPRAVAEGSTATACGVSTRARRPGANAWCPAWSLSVWFLLTTRARRWAPPLAALTRWWPSTDPESSPSLQGATTARCGYVQCTSNENGRKANPPKTKAQRSASSTA